MINNSQITFQSLASTDIETLLQCFNESFKNYYVPLQLTKEQLADKIYGDAIDLKLSFGAFDNNQLVAFILTGVDTVDDQLVAYNAGTGVLPGYRGRKLSYSLYEYSIQQLKNHGIKKCILEVIDQNMPAIKTYGNIGFSTKRKLISYKGKPECITDPSIEIKPIQQPDWKMVEEMCDWQRSWQYNNNTLKRIWNNYTMLIADADNNAEAYCIVSFKNGRIAHFGSSSNDPRFLSSLFAHLGETLDTPLIIINIDEKAEAANTFTSSIKLEKFIIQNEMEMDL